MHETERMQTRVKQFVKHLNFAYDKFLQVNLLYEVTSNIMISGRHIPKDIFLFGMNNVSQTSPPVWPYWPHWTWSL